MSNIKNALMDVEIANEDLNTRRDELSTFRAANEYTRGGSYPKEIASRKTDLASTIVRLHLALLRLGLTEVPARDVKVSRRVTIRAQSVYDGGMYSLRRRNTHA